MKEQQQRGSLSLHWSCPSYVSIQPSTVLQILPPSFEQQVADSRPYLLKFARLQLRNDAWAEDAVSETLLAALCRPKGFDQRSKLKTWLVGILKHKIIDTLRKNSREVCISNGDEDEITDPLDYIAYKIDGHFAEKPADWGDPEQEMISSQFFEVLEACTDKLPPAQGRLFLMREWLELSSEDICTAMSMSPNNLFVQLHRARLRLRECLELNWFASQSPK